MGDHLQSPSFISYYGLLHLQARTFEVIARELEARTGLPASWYELLACLQSEPEGKRMNELADELLISRGGATKIVARLEEAGYVERVTPKTDRRATFARLTAKGERAVNEAHPVQLELTEEHFGRFLDAAEHAQLVAMSRKVLHGLGTDCDWLEMVGTDECPVASPAEGAATAAAGAPRPAGHPR